MELTDEQVASWLENAFTSLTIGHDPALRAVLRAHGHPADHSNPKVVSLWARDFLKEMIMAVQPDPRAPEPEWVPYRVLGHRFLNRYPLRTIARGMGLSRRQASRALAEGIHQLRVRLESPSKSS